MGIPVKLTVFEGPLDLLLHLIEKNKVNIYDIPIVEITDQYMDYIHQMEREDLNIMLLPKEVDEEGEEKDPREELVRQLLEYKMYKYMSYELRDKMAEAAKSIYKLPSLPKEVEDYKEPIDPQELLAGMTLAKLHKIFEDVLRRQENKKDPIRSKFGKIEQEEVSLPEKMSDVELYARTHKQFSFRELLGKQASKFQVVVTFLAILELMKTGKIRIYQEHIFDDIQIASLV